MDKLLIISLLSIGLVFAQDDNTTVVEDPLIAINDGDTAWMLSSSALVLIMTPGLAFFYGGK